MRRPLSGRIVHINTGEDANATKGVTVVEETGQGPVVTTLAAPPVKH